MNLGDRLRNHKTNPITPAEAVRITDALASRGGNYRTIAEFVCERSGMGADEWETLLYEGDTANNGDDDR